MAAWIRARGRSLPTPSLISQPLSVRLLPWAEGNRPYSWPCVNSRQCCCEPSWVVFSPSSAQHLAEYLRGVICQSRSCPLWAALSDPSHPALGTVGTLASLSPLLHFLSSVSLPCLAWVGPPTLLPVFFLEGARWGTCSSLHLGFLGLRDHILCLIPNIYLRSWSFQHFR